MTTSEGCKGRLFGPGLPGAGVPATGMWNSDGHWSVTADELEFCAESPTITAAGFNAAAVRISWRATAGEYAFILETEEARRRCAAAAPPHIARQLGMATGVQTRLERRFRLGGLLLALILALPLVGIGLFLFNADRVADWAVKRIPPAQEAQLGDLVLAQSRLQMRIVDRGPAVDAITAIGKKLTPNTVHRYRWYVADRPDINAFAAPGGVVVVFRGLLQSAGSAEELAGVLAHEIAHAELRHSLRGMVKSLGLRALVSLIIGDVSGSIFTDAATRLTDLRFSREAELEADRNGLRRLVAARIDPAGMIRFYEKLAAEKRPTPPAILSTHPATGDRLERLRQEVKTLRDSWEPLAINLEQAKASLP